MSVGDTGKRENGLNAITQLRSEQAKRSSKKMKVGKNTGKRSENVRASPYVNVNAVISIDRRRKRSEREKRNDGWKDSFSERKKSPRDF